jgi:indole-3-glycerol phosphate synthase / phosphoribosylanthranilate isomerase
MPGFMHEITLHKQKEVALRKAAGATLTQVRPGTGRFLPGLQGTGTKLITEIKPSSPSAGTLRTKIDVDAIVNIYDRYADCISVLTDYKYFGGSLDVLSEVSAKSIHPTLCKDFIVDTFQISEARAAGAEAVLLIVKLVGDSLLQILHDEVLRLGMTPVVEIQNERELERALSLKPQLLLINNRDLDTFHTDLGTTERLAPMIPPTVTTVSASGVNSRADIDRLLPFCTRFLVGSVLMQAEDMEYKLRELAGIAQ